MSGLTLLTLFVGLSAACSAVVARSLPKPLPVRVDVLCLCRQSQVGQCGNSKPVRRLAGDAEAMAMSDRHRFTDADTIAVMGLSWEELQSFGHAGRKKLR